MSDIDPPAFTRMPSPPDDSIRSCVIAVHGLVNAGIVQLHCFDFLERYLRPSLGRFSDGIDETRKAALYEQVSAAMDRYCRKHGKNRSDYTIKLIILHYPPVGVRLTKEGRCRRDALEWPATMLEIVDD